MLTITVLCKLIINGKPVTQEEIDVPLSIRNTSRPDLPALTYGIINTVGAKMFGSDIHTSLVGDIELKTADRWVIKSSNTADCLSNIAVSYEITNVVCDDANIYYC